ncbi:MAG: Oligopeptide ABC transporter, periplasmic oligopeptide-binding protein OppA [uncultured Friedmanniella sp.]|uniref:Oligopeptide ABC transporter, periplasmic oligopeptide-binding protein OppA n=1 Tax=uncultured Friedmanniella sp. TaxID=335381 RepID=A0A6J4L342_9ACTN|nr:MAG: Oligopeptide ABC transporter, periplasmic oligopeptide-binding protein OppA [uncultured Friedmanniella sp.]
MPSTSSHPSRRRPRLLVTLLAVVAFVLPLFALPSAGAQIDDANTLRVHQRNFPSLLDPHQLGFVDDIAVVGLLYEGLTRLDSKMDVVPGAAESWEFSEDGLTLTFHLHEGLTYSDGSPLTAERFRDAALRTCAPLTAGLYQAILFNVAGCQAYVESLGPVGEGTPVATPVSDERFVEDFGVTAPDDRTLVVELLEPAPYFPAIASMQVFFPAKQELIEAGGEGWWLDPAYHVGNGPFVMDTVDEDQQITFRANDAYWAGRPALDGIEYRYIQDNAVALQAYQQGDVDIMWVDPSQIEAINEDPTLAEQFVQFPGTSTLSLNFNLREAPFDDKRVREAFAYGFDRATWCAEVFNGGCLPTTEWIPQGVMGAVDDDTYAFDPEKARQALAASSYGGPDGLPEITYTYVSDDPAETTRAEWIAGQYRDILGVEVELEGLEFATWVDRFTSPDNFPQLTGAGWVQDYPDAQNWLSIIWACEATNLAVNVGYCNEEFDALIAQADAELDPAARTALYAEAHRLLLADVPAVMTHNEARQYLVHPGVGGYEPTGSDYTFPGERGSLLTLDIQR